MGFMKTLGGGSRPHRAAGRMFISSGQGGGGAARFIRGAGESRQATARAG